MITDLKTGLVEHLKQAGAYDSAFVVQGQVCGKDGPDHSPGAQV